MSFKDTHEFLIGRMLDLRQAVVIGAEQKRLIQFYINNPLTSTARRERWRPRRLATGNLVRGPRNPCAALNGSRRRHCFPTVTSFTLGDEDSAVHRICHGLMANSTVNSLEGWDSTVHRIWS
ncbi:hypothetical protein GUJ93_ZPchr0006g44515 [Zizania palustris]|uniref:Uncharacterized protein n=1 Tax=Zizania palustris TaxID=103762 RepID=A0A8J5SXY2_ZIZPA|nr:hypothetical protein GUJ93_ZPchr0006g44515 [Zizania palustris]